MKKIWIVLYILFSPILITYILLHMIMRKITLLFFYIWCSNESDLRMVAGWYGFEVVKKEELERLESLEDTS